MVNKRSDGQTQDLSTACSVWAGPIHDEYLTKLNGTREFKQFKKKDISQMLNYVFILFI